VYWKGESTLTRTSQGGQVGSTKVGRSSPSSRVGEEVDDGKGGRKTRAVKDEEKKIREILREMRIIPRRVEHLN